MANNNLTLRTVNSPYIGNSADFTKGSVLTHKELDNNFIFLKGEDIITGSTSGTTLILTQVNNDTIEVDLLPLLNNPDNFTTGATLDGHSIYFNTKDSLSAYTVDLSSISGDTNTDNYTTGSTLIGTTVYYNRTDAVSAFTTDLSGLLPAKTNYGNIIFVSEVGSTGLTRSDVIGNVNIPISLDSATQIAQSGDTIHVKSGIYTTTTTATNGLSVSGVNHYFEPNSKVSKTTTGPMFGKSTGSTESNVYGSGSFYGSGSCGYIFQNNGLEGNSYTQVYEWDICENSSTGCLISVSNENGTFKGKRSIVSSGGAAITTTDNNDTIKARVLIDCPLIKSTVAQGILQSSLSGATSNEAKLTVNSNDIIGVSDALGGVHLGTNGNGLICTVNANYINYVCNTDNGLVNKDVTFNVTRIDRITDFHGTHLKVNGHLGYLIGDHKGVMDISLVDRCWGTGSAVINATLNGGFNMSGDTYGIARVSAGKIPNLISSFAGNLVINYKLQNPSRQGGYETVQFVKGWMFTNAGNVLNFLGKWDLDGSWCSMASGVLNIPSGTEINIGPTAHPSDSYSARFVPNTFGFANTSVNISGTIIQRAVMINNIPQFPPQSTIKNVPMLMYIDTESVNTNIVFNGAVIIVRDQNSQILTAKSSLPNMGGSVQGELITGATVNIYSGGLNTNKMNSFAAEKEKIRVLVTGSTASYTISGGTAAISGGTETFSAHTFTTTTGTTAAGCALELTSLTNASLSAKVTTSQDNSGVDEYFYIESDVPGVTLNLGYNSNTVFDATLRHNSIAITEGVGGTLIEDEHIIRGQYG
tara:strand:+ start:153 stop:2591 length:2439 start_codon:yes stop_codon:yes gene_type:complete